MSLILKQETSGSVTTPPAGRSTVYVDTTGQLGVKQPNGDTGVVPTIASSNTQVIFNDEDVLVGDAALTFNATTGTLTTGNLAVSGDSNLGAVGNITITGGSSGYVLSTDGAGNLSWASGGGIQSSIANGTSSVTIPTSDGNIRLRSNGSYVANITETGANIFGYLSVSGSAILAGPVNLGTVGNITITGGSSGYVLRTDGAGNLSWVAQSGGSTNSISNGNTNVTISSPSGNVTTTVDNTPNVVVVSNTGAFVSGAVSASGLVTAGNFYTSGTMTVSGNANIGNIGTTGVVTATGNVRGGNLNTAGLVSGAEVSSSGNAYLGNVITGGYVFATGNVSGGNLSVSGVSTLGPVSNVKITGGTSGYVLSTDGAGNLSWTSGGGGGSANLEQVDTDILPIFDSVYDIGSNSYRFYDTYLGGNLNINGAKLTASTPLLGGNAVFSTSNDVVLSGALLADLLLVTDNMITPDASTARQYMGDKGVVVINGDLDVDGDWLGTPTVQTVAPVVGHTAGDSLDLFGSGFDNSPTTVAVQSDGKIIFGGQFTTYNGETLPSPNLVRLNTDGTIDYTWQTLGVNGSVYAITVQSDDKVWIGGYFTQVGGYTLNRIALLDSNGIVNSTFLSNVGANGFNSAPSAICVLPSGLVAIGGDFTTYLGTTSQYFIIINESGTIAYSGLNFNAQVSDIALDGAGKLMVVGSFTSYQTAPAYKVVRLLSNGVRDTSFLAALASSSPTDSINGVAVQSDGKIVLVGHFTTYQSLTANNIVRVNTNGTTDTSFVTGGLGGFYVTGQKVAIQADGKIIVVGQFIQYDGVDTYYLVRINTDGSFDTTFVNKGLNGTAFDLALTSDGDYIICGGFASYGGVQVGGVVALYGATVESVVGSTPPTGGEAGFMRYNSDISAFQGYNGTSWELLERCTTPPQSVARATSLLEIDFTGGTLLTTTGGGFTWFEFTGVNYLPGSSVTIRVVADPSSSNSLHFPSAWVFVGTTPTQLDPGTTAILTVTSFGTTAADCVAAWAVSA